jgi:hypothetical protein
MLGVGHETPDVIILLSGAGREMLPSILFDSNGSSRHVGCKRLCGAISVHGTDRAACEELFLVVTR